MPGLILSIFIQYHITFTTGLLAEVQREEGRVMTLIAGEPETPFPILVSAFQVSERQPLLLLVPPIVP